jgi:hypothetical protein
MGGITDMTILKFFLWIQIIGVVSYASVSIAMIYGWGIEPKSWFWIIFGYTMANNVWILAILVRQKLLEALGVNMDEGGQR